MSSPEIPRDPSDVTSIPADVSEVVLDGAMYDAYSDLITAEYSHLAIESVSPRVINVTSDDHEKRVKVVDALFAQIGRVAQSTAHAGYDGVRIMWFSGELESKKISSIVFYSTQLDVQQLETTQRDLLSKTNQSLEDLDSPYRV